MKMFLKLILAATSFSFITACGGGGGGTGTETSTQKFNLLAAYTSEFEKNTFHRFTATGDGGLTGAGTVTRGVATSGIFEGKSALQRTVVVTGNLNINGVVTPLNSVTVQWANNSLLPAGSVGDEYSVVFGAVNIPNEIIVGDTGILFSSNRYSNSSKTIQLGTVVSSYVVEADTATSAMVTIINTHRSISNQLQHTTTEKLKITADNKITRINQTYLSDDLSFMIRF